MLCPKCGTNVQDDWALCPKCGTNMAEVRKALGVADTNGVEDSENSDGFEPIEEDSSVVKNEAGETGAFGVSEETAKTEEDSTESTEASEVKETSESADSEAVKNDSGADEGDELAGKDEEKSEEPAKAEEVDKSKLSKKELKALQKKEEEEKAKAEKERKKAEKEAKKAKKAGKDDKSKDDKPKEEEDKIDNSKSLAEKRKDNATKEKFNPKIWALEHKPIVVIAGIVFVIIVLVVVKKLTAKPDVSFWTTNRSIVTQEVGSYSYTLKFTDSDKPNDEFTLYLIGCTADNNPEKLSAWFRISVNKAENELFAGVINGDGIWKLDFSNYSTCVKSLGLPYLMEEFNTYSPEVYLTIPESEVHLQDAYKRFILAYSIATNGYGCETETIQYNDCNMLTKCFTGFSDFWNTIQNNLENNKIVASELSGDLVYDSLQPIIRYITFEKPECKFDGLTRVYNSGTEEAPISNAEATIDITIGKYKITVSSYRKGESSNFTSKCSGEESMDIATYKKYLGGLRQIINANKPLGIYIYKDNDRNSKIMQSILVDKGHNLDELEYSTKQFGNNYEGIIDLYDVYKAYSIEEMKDTDLIFLDNSYKLTSGVGFDLKTSVYENSSSILKMTVAISNPTAKDFVFNSSDVIITSGRGNTAANSLTLLQGVFKEFDGSLIAQEYKIPAGSRGTIELYFPCQLFDVPNYTLVMYTEPVGKVAEMREVD